MRDAIMTLEEETGVSRAQATSFVRELVRRKRVADRNVAERLFGSVSIANVTLREE